MRNFSHGVLMVCASAAISVAGCTAPLAKTQNFDLAQYALENRSVPPQVLRAAGLPDRHEVMPFICGSGTTDATAMIEKIAASRPAEEREAILAEWRQALASRQKPDPEYVVDLTHVAEVRVGWLGSQRIVILRHPVALDKTACGTKHPSPTTRLRVSGNHLSGPGPATIWSGGRLLAFVDDPWILTEGGPYSPPWLLRVWDHTAMDGPIEVTVSLTREEGTSQRIPCLMWIYAKNGDSFELVTPAPGVSRGAATLMRWSEGHRIPYARIAVDKATGEVSSVVLDSNT